MPPRRRRLEDDESDVAVKPEPVPASQRSRPSEAAVQSSEISDHDEGNDEPIDERSLFDQPNFKLSSSIESDRAKLETDLSKALEGAHSAISTLHASRMLLLKQHDDAESESKRSFDRTKQSYQKLDERLRLLDAKRIAVSKLKEKLQFMVYPCASLFTLSHSFKRPGMPSSSTTWSISTH